jgi:hypothetical protein
MTREPAAKGLSSTQRGFDARQGGHSDSPTGSPELPAVPGPGRQSGRCRVTSVTVAAVAAWLHVLAVAAWVPRTGFATAEVVRGAVAAAASFSGLLLAALAVRWAFARAGVGPRPSREAAMDALGIGALMGAVAISYTWVKLLIPALNGRLWDAQFGVLDRWLCFGVDPNRFLLAILEGNPRFVGLALDWIYGLWMPLTSLATIVLLTSPVTAMRRRGAISVAVLWLAGVWLYVAFPALGPALVDIGLWEQVRLAEPLAATSQHVLLRNYAGVNSILAGTPTPVAVLFGVAAMPSLHVGLDVLLALWARHQARWWAWLWWIFAGITTVGAVATGWHYLVDAIGGAALAGAVYPVAAVRGAPSPE